MYSYAVSQQRGTGSAGCIGGDYLNGLIIPNIFSSLAKVTVPVGFAEELIHLSLFLSLPLEPHLKRESAAAGWAHVRWGSFSFGSPDL